MNLLMLFLFALGLGVVAAIPLGGCQVETAKRAVGGHLHAAWMVAFGSATSDLAYGAITLFGVAPLVEYPRLSMAFNALGAVLLWVMAYLTCQQSRHRQHLALANRGLKSLGQDDLGTVAAGRSADFIVLDANPLGEITNTRTISRVYLRGVPIDRAKLRAGFMNPPAARMTRQVIGGAPAATSSAPAASDSLSADADVYYRPVRIRTRSDVTVRMAPLDKSVPCSAIAAVQ